LPVKPATAFPEIDYITVIFSYVSATNCSLNRLNLLLLFHRLPHGKSVAGKKLPDQLIQKGLTYSFSFVYFK